MNTEKLLDRWDLTAEQIIGFFEKYLHKVAGDLLGSGKDSPIYEDVVQEGRIKLWKILVDRRPPANYLAKAAKLRMIQIAYSLRPETGGDSKPGPKSRPITNGVDWELLEYGGDTSELAVIPLVADCSDHVAMQSDIVEALRELPERQRQDAVAVMYDSPRTDHRQWKRTTRPMLAAKLAHLQEA